MALPQRPARSEVSGEVADAASSAGEPSQTELLAAIQGSRVALEGMIETVAVEVNLLRADLWKVSDKVKAAEGIISELQSELGTLRTQMAQATSTVGRLEAWLEDAEGRLSQSRTECLQKDPTALSYIDDMHITDDDLTEYLSSVERLVTLLA
ncbi:hypothetical protein NDU88_001391 [Pleurodeles waltl]|uniref:Uncharacterized protein n=1 Tax=Pleurodeles waltl TaxID=8319 RepID=A0AAV7W031_PLEWA|nr:hypothetical protein NDU88_001391 [Pleurodeles waltl]